MAPRLISCWFDLPTDTQWSRLARVLTFSAATQCPDWSREIRPLVISGSKRSAAMSAGYWANTLKLDEWAATVAAAAEGDRLALLDTDTMLTGPLDPVWQEPFDVAITRRPPGTPFPLNAGVLFLRVNERSRAFVCRWRDENRAMLADSARHMQWRRHYGGINQAALGSLLQTAHGAQICELPCAVWNCEDASWMAFGPHTKIVHLKSALRKAVFRRSPASAALLPLVKMWYGLERAALEAEGLPPERSTAASARPGLTLPLRSRGRPPGPETLVHSVRLPTDVYDACCRLARANREPVSAIIHRALEQHLSGISVVEK